MIEGLKELEAVLRKVLHEVEREKFKKTDIESEIDALKERRDILKAEVNKLAKAEKVAQDEVKKEKSGVYASIDRMNNEAKESLKDAKGKLTDVQSAEVAADSAKRAYELQVQNLWKKQDQADKLIAEYKEKLQKAEKYYTSFR